MARPISRPMRWVYAAFALAIAGVLFNRTMLAPRAAALDDRRDETRRLGEQLAEASARAERRAAGAAEASAADEALHALAVERSAPELIGAIVDRVRLVPAARGCAVELFETDTPTADAAGRVEETPFRLDVTGPYAAVVALLRDLEGGYPIAHVRSVDVSRAEALAGGVTAELRGALYVVVTHGAFAPPREVGEAGEATEAAAAAVARGAAPPAAGVARDPFSPRAARAVSAAVAGGPPRARASSAASVAAAPAATRPFRGVLERRGVRSALFGSRSYAAGETIAGWTIREIGEKSCVVERNAVRKTLKPGEAP
jgi:hypothetical protein